MSFQVNFNTHGNDLKAAHEAVISEKDDTNWLIYAFDKGTYDLRVQATGDGGLEELNDEFSDGKVQFALAKVIDPNTELPKYVFIGWCGSGVPELRKAFFNSQLSDVSKFFKSFHVQINARDEADVEPSLIMKRVAESSGANYSVHKEGSKPQSRVTPVGSVYKKTEIPNIAAMQRESMTKENAPTPVGTNYKPVTTTPRKMEQRWNVATSQDSGAGAVRAERERFEKEVRDREIEKSKQVVPDRTYEQDQRRQQEQEARQQEEEARQYEQDQRRQQEESRRYEEDQRQQEEEQRRQEQERQQEESRYQQQLEDQRRQEEDAQRKQEEEERQHAQRQRDESEKQRQQEEQRRAQQEQQEKQRQEEEQRRRQQEENERREQEEHQRQQKEQEEKKRQEETAALESQLSNTADRAVHAAGAAAATATHASDASQGVSAVVLFAYEASENNEMSLAEGEVVHQIDQVDEGWWFGVSEDGKKEGLFPANYVQILEVEAAPEAPPAPPAPPAAPSPPPQQQQEQQHTAVALYDYEAEEDNEISFKEGDVITQIEFVSDDWWQGVAANGKSLGLFPANYVEYKG